MARGHAGLCAVPLEGQWAVWSVIRSIAQGLQEMVEEGAWLARSNCRLAAPVSHCPVAGQGERADQASPHSGVRQRKTEGPGGGHTGHVRQGPEMGPWG